MTEYEANLLAAKWADARFARDFARADEIKAQLAAAGVGLKATREGTRIFNIVRCWSRDGTRFYERRTCERFLPEPSLFRRLLNAHSGFKPVT